MRPAAALLTAFGALLLFTGPVLALLSLLVSVDAGRRLTSAGEGAIAATHVVGLLAGLLGAVLLLAGGVWLLRDLWRARSVRRSAA